MHNPNALCILGFKNIGFASHNLIFDRLICTSLNEMKIFGDMGWEIQNV